MATGNFNCFHLKQIFSMARSHHLTSEDLASKDRAESAARVLGAECGAFGTIERGESGGWQLEFSVFDLHAKKSTHASLALPDDAAKAVRQGGRAIAGAIASLYEDTLAENVPLHPETVSAEAMDAYLECYRVIINQPLGLRKSHVISHGLLVQARRDCLMAVKADPDFGAAWAALSLVYSLSFNKDDAARALKHAEASKGYLAYEPIADYWWKTRFKGSPAGAAVLAKAVADFPGALLFLVYHGEHLNITRDYDKALASWDRYLKMVPTSSYAMAQKGYSLARLARMNESITLTTQACRLDPDDMELKLELASRLVDAGQLKGAESILQPLSRDKQVFGEVLLRLGYVYLLQGRNDEAERLLENALKISTGPNEWRTRGRTRYDLAIVMARKGRLDEAEKHLLDAEWEGFMFKEVLKNNVDLQALADRPKLSHLFTQEAPLHRKLRLSTTPFPVDYSGQIVPDKKRTPPSMTGVSF